MKGGHSKRCIAGNNPLIAVAILSHLLGFFAYLYKRDNELVVCNDERESRGNEQPDWVV